jgi:hypothetical protein
MVRFEDSTHPTTISRRSSRHHQARVQFVGQWADEVVEQVERGGGFVECDRQRRAEAEDFSRESAEQVDAVSAEAAGFDDFGSDLRSS